MLETLDHSGRTITSLVLAAMAFTTGCSGAEDIDAVEGDVPSGAAPAAVEAVPPAPSDGEIQRGTPGSDTGTTAMGTTEAAGAAASAAAPASPNGGSDSAAAAGSRAPVLAEADGEGAADEGGADDGPALPTMMTSGRMLLDTCGKPFVTRGVEQIFGEQLPQGNDWSGLLEEIAESGVNAVRVLVSTDTLNIDDIDQLLSVVAKKGLVAYITPYGNEGMRWLEGQDVRAMLAQHEKYILIDAFGEPTFDDRERFIAEATRALRDVRSWGYRVPLTVTANQFGRDLPSLFELGDAVLAADPLHNTVFGWQAYWSQNGYYQEHYGYTLSEAVDEIAKASFPIQLGLDRVTDFPASDTADYGTLMSATAKHGIGWLWWDWYNPYGSENNLTEDGTAGRLTATGSAVIETHAASVEKTAERVCVR